MNKKTMNILLDIDGCITDGKGKVVDLIALQTLKQRIKESPYTTALCTGRSALYVEAIAQMIDIQNWCICENGAYLYHTVTEEVVFHPIVTKESFQHLQQIKQEILTHDTFTKVCKMELGKEVCISLNPLNIEIESLFKYIKQQLDLTGLYIAHSTTAVDITPKGINKGSTLKLLCEHEGWVLDDILGIGDSMGDMSFLRLCGKVACPANAIKDIKTISQFVSKQPSTKGLIEIYNFIQ